MGGGVGHVRVGSLSRYRVSIRIRLFFYTVHIILYMGMYNYNIYICLLRFISSLLGPGNERLGLLCRFGDRLLFLEDNHRQIHQPQALAEYRRLSRRAVLVLRGRGGVGEVAGEGVGGVRLLFFFCNGIKVWGKGVGGLWGGGRYGGGEVGGADEVGGWRGMG